MKSHEKGRRTFGEGIKPLGDSPSFQSLKNRIVPTSDKPRKRKSPEIIEPAQTHAERLERPVYRTAPDTFIPVARFGDVKVFKKLYSKDSEARSLVAIQFPDHPEGLTPTRREKDKLEALHLVDGEARDREKFTYKHGLWTRHSAAGEAPGPNILGGKQLAELIDNERAPTRSR